MSRIGWTLAIFVPLLGTSAQAVTMRLQPSLAVGAAYSSDLFLGADIGPSFEGQFTPALRLDVSASPRVKLWSSAESALGLYQATKGAALAHALEVGTRVRLGTTWVAEWSLFGNRDDVSTPTAIDKALGLRSSSALGVATLVSLRYQGRVRGSADYRVSARRYMLEDGLELRELSHFVALSVATRAGPATLTRTLNGLREESAPEFSYLGGAAGASAALSPFERAHLAVSTWVHTNHFPTGRRDWLMRATILPSVRATSNLLVEAAYGFAVNLSSLEERTAQRHYVYGGIRLEGDLWWR